MGGRIKQKWRSRSLRFNTKPLGDMLKKFKKNGSGDGDGDAAAAGEEADQPSALPTGLGSRRGRVMGARNAGASSLNVGRSPFASNGPGVSPFGAGGLRRGSAPAAEAAITYKQAFKRGRYGDCVRFLDDGLDPNTTDIHGSFLLHVVSRRGHGRVANLLMDRGANVDAMDMHGNTPVQVCCGATAMKPRRVRFALSVALLFIFAPPPFCVVDQIASALGYVDILSALIARGASVTLVDYYGESPLHKPVSQEGRGHVECFRILLDNRADLDTATFEDEMTALHYAAYNDYTECVRLLLQAGAGESSAALMLTVMMP